MFKTQLETELGEGRIQHNKNIAHYLTLRTKTSAEYYFEAESREDLQKATKLSYNLNIPLILFGGGSNLAITKEVLEGLIVRNLYKKKELLKESPDLIELQVSSGYPMARLVTETVKSGWEGFEYHLGLPGTIGGGLFMNSKWTKPLSYLGDNLKSAEILGRDGTIKKVDKDYFKFAYDYSYLQETKEIVLEAVFKLKKTDVETLKKRSQEALKYRHETQPFGVATGGCFFQNVSGESAGKMIDEAGLKNLGIGGFFVSDKHANFIINKGEGNPDDLLKLINLIKVKVKEKFGVDLKEEVRII